MVSAYDHFNRAPFVVGVVLERFFKALVLFPTCMVVLMVVVVRAACVGHGLLNAILEFAVVITSLQIGYASNPRVGCGSPHIAAC